MSKFSALSASFRAFAGATAVAAAVVAAPACAAPFYVQDAFYFDSTAMADTTNVDPATMYFISPFKITASDSVGPSSLTDYIAFCIQLDVDMFGPTENLTNAGDTINAQYYDDNTLLLGDDRAAVARLVNYGTAFFKGLPSSFASMDDFYAASDELAAVQGAIWKITNPGINLKFDVGVYGSQAAVNDNRLSMLFTQATSGTELNSYSGSIRTLYTDDMNPVARQGLAVSISVPEPMTWALMLVGFFSVGGVLRASRRRPPQAA